MKKGFTLVELSIVLVIIGLLIGGILVGQNLIESAKINAFVRQIQQLDISASQFKQKYRCLPGDSNKFEPQGNCDGNIYATNGTANRFDGEISSFWAHLKGSGSFLYDGNLVASDFKLDVTMPKSKIGTNCGILIGKATAGDLILSRIPTNMYSIQRYAIVSSSAKTIRTYPCMQAINALAVDQKMDNGLASSGSVVAGAANPSVDITTFNNNANNCFVYSGGAYLTANATQDPCGLHIKMFLNGDN